MSKELSIPAIKEKGFLSKSFDPERQKELMAANFPDGITPFTLQKIRTEGTNATKHHLETSSGVQEVDAITGVLLCPIAGVAKRTRYEGAYNPSIVQPPKCFSTDGRIGIGEPGGNCIRCPEASNGGTCKPRVNWYFIHSGEKLVSNLSVSLTAQKYLQAYLRALMSEDCTPFEVLTEISFSKKGNDRANTMTFKNVGKLTPEEIAKAKALRDYLQSMKVAEGSEVDDTPDAPAEEVPF